MRLKELIKGHKAFLIWLAAMAGGWVLHQTIGHRVLAALYGAGWFPPRNGLMGLPNKSLDHYMLLFDRGTFMLLLVISFVWLLQRLTYSTKKVPLLWPLCLAVFSVTTVYVLNPNFRVYAHHGFIHAGLTYQILEGSVPPTNPLLAGEPATYPWGFEWCAAGLCRVCNITPFRAYALINVVSLVGVILLTYHLSRLLLPDHNAALFSVIVTLFATTVTGNYVLHPLCELFQIFTDQTFTDSRGIPLSIKFFNINGAPLGLLFFLLFLASITHYFCGKRPWSSLPPLTISVLGCGFVYPQFLPVLYPGAVCVCLQQMAVTRKELRLLRFGQSVGVMIVLAISSMLLWPYFSLISPTTRGTMMFFNLNIFGRNFLNYLVLFIPLGIVILLKRNYLLQHANRQVINIFLVMILVSAFCYFSMHMNFRNEYKAMFLSAIPLGVVGGVAFAAMSRGRQRSVVFVLILLFTLPAYQKIFHKLKMHGNVPVTFVERGRYLYSQDPADHELYEWIRLRTAPGSVFADTTNEVPVFAQRSLLIGVDNTDEAVPAVSLGYGGKAMPVSTFLRDICGYERRILKWRRNLVDNIYGRKDNLTTRQMADGLSRFGAVYAIARTPEVQRKMNPEIFTNVFRSSDERAGIYKFTSEGSEPENIGDAGGDRAE